MTTTTTRVKRIENNSDIKYRSTFFDRRSNFELYGLDLLSVGLVTLV